MYIKENKLGIISGFIFGLFSVVYGTMGLASNVAATIGAQAGEVGRTTQDERLLYSGVFVSSAT